MMPLCGGVSESHAVNDDHKKIVEEIRPAVEEKTGKKYSTFQPVDVKTQVVAGTNYFFKVKVDNDSYVHVRVFQNLQGNKTVHGVQEDQKEHDELKYF